MVSDRGRAAAGSPSRAAPAIDERLLDAKLSVPQPRDGTVSRRDLIASARSSTCRLVSMIAPAGYGKSTLLAEWAELDDRPIVLRLARSVRRRSGGPDRLAGHGVRSRPAGERPAGRRCERDRRFGIGPLCSTAGGSVPSRSGPVRAHARRSPRAAITGVSRRARSRDRGCPSGLAAGHRQPGGATARGSTSNQR